MAAKVSSSAPIKLTGKMHQPDVRFVPIAELNFWKNNPWKHDDKVPGLAALLATYGQASPVIAWRKNNVIYKGNHTKKALMYLAANLEKVAEFIKQTVDEILSKVNPGLIKVEFRDFPSEAAANAYGISDNNSSQGGEYDDAVLRQMLMTDDAYMSGARTGFSERELKAFKLSTDGMEKLANVDLQGETEELGAFLILKFDSEDMMQQFKRETGMAKNERAINYAKLVELF